MADPGAIPNGGSVSLATKVAKSGAVQAQIALALQNNTDAPITIDKVDPITLVDNSAPGLVVLQANPGAGDGAYDTPIAPGTTRVIYIQIEGADDSIQNYDVDATVNFDDHAAYNVNLTGSLNTAAAGGV